ncbi:DUF2291 domain-containing protein [Lapillicoccus sp.]|uniref:DUF2291 family protein n=1 Tax=Lapillicoccus sp. TaxID=1909287 RepID=UPI0025FB872F|nr:DUF2291 domain-containing protein [Lapillicoccus sp.]
MRAVDVEPPGTESPRTGPARTSPRTRTLARTAVPLLVLVAMAFGTKVVSLDDTAAAGPKVFDPATYGKTEFPKVQAALATKAVPAAVLAKALAADPTAAAKQYGVKGGTGPEFSVSLTGTVGAGQSGIYTVTVAGLPATLVIRVQTGPAINGTDLRDATGTVTFGQFTNQIEYQNAASALNTQMKQQVLAPLGTAPLTGKTITLVGAFQLINPNGWLITPAKLTVS